MNPTNPRGRYETSPLPDKPRSLAERLRWLRKRRGLTQVEASQAIGCDQAMISSWEVGRTRPSAVTLGALAQHFGVSLHALDTGEGFMEEAVKAEVAEMDPAKTKADGDSTLQVLLQPTIAGGLMVVDATTGRQERMDTAEGMARLLQALRRGRQGWIVLK